jgi:quinol monooxygenase YgiN
MATEDKCCSIVPYFKIHQGRMDEFRRLCEAFVERSSTEPKCLYYGFSFHDDRAHCREGYEDAEGLLAHVENVGDLLQEAMKIADVTQLEIHGPESELAKLRGPLSELNAAFFSLEHGFRR